MSYRRRYHSPFLKRPLGFLDGMLSVFDLFGTGLTKMTDEYLREREDERKRVRNQIVTIRIYLANVGGDLQKAIDEITREELINGVDVHVKGQAPEVQQHTS